MEYNVVRGDTIEELITSVNGAIAEGWELQAGVSVAYIPNTNSWYYCQAMTREANNL